MVRAIFGVRYIRVRTTDASHDPAGWRVAAAAVSYASDRVLHCVPCRSGPGGVRVRREEGPGAPSRKHLWQQGTGSIGHLQGRTLHGGRGPGGRQCKRPLCGGIQTRVRLQQGLQLTFKSGSRGVAQQKQLSVPSFFVASTTQH